MTAAAVATIDPRRPASGLASRLTEAAHGHALPEDLRELLSSWKRVLLLPAAWDSFDTACADFSPGSLRALATKHAGLPVLLRPATIQNLKRGGGGSQSKYLKATLRDSEQCPVVMTSYGECKELERILERHGRGTIGVAGVLQLQGQTYTLSEPIVVPLQYEQRIMPSYPLPLKGREAAHLQLHVRERLQETLEDDALRAADWIIREGFRNDPQALQRAMGLDASRAQAFFTRALLAVHRPTSLESTDRAMEALDRAAAMIAVIQGLNSSASDEPLAPAIHTAMSIRDMQDRFGKTLTTDQVGALRQIIEDLSREEPMHRLLSGDVGSGKTPVFGLAAIAVAHAGYTVSIMLPSKPLARQVLAEVVEWGSDLPIALVMEGSWQGPASARIIVGTTGMLHDPRVQPDLVVVDEQQSFSAEQREGLRRRKPGQVAHLLEATATCIPRSQALVELGVLKVSPLTSAHVTKQIETKVWTSDQARQLFASVEATVAGGGKVLVVYPAKDAVSERPSLKGASATETIARKKLHSALEYAPLWEQRFPGIVRVIHGGDDPSQDKRNALAIADLVQGRAAIGVGTTVLERGLDIPNIRQVVAVQADRLGLSQIHQLRGRLARQGGHGRCDLYLPYPVSKSALSRLDLLTRETDGFKIAAADLADRGCGDISADAQRQHGSLNNIFYGRSLSMGDMEQAIDLLPHLFSNTRA